MHIQLWDDNRDKALKMSKVLGAPNRYLNEFFSRVESNNFIESMQKLLREDHVKIEISIVSLEPEEKRNKL